MSGVKVKCPTCDKKVLFHGNEFRPFCSEKCKMVDLGHWFSESYAIETSEKDFTEIDEQNDEPYVNHGDE